MKKNTIFETSGWIFKRAGKHRKHIFLAMGFSVISAALSIVPMVCLYFIVMQFLGERPVSFSDQAILLGVGTGAILLRSLFYLAAMSFSHICAYGMHYELRASIASHLALLPLGFFNQKSSGSLKKIMGDDIENMEAFVAHYIPDVLSALVLPVITAAFLMSISPMMTVAALLPVVIAFFMHSRMNRVYGENVGKFHDNMEAMNAIIVEYIRGMPVIKAFGQTTKSFLRYRDSLKAHARISRAWGESAAGYASFFWVCLDLGMVFVLPLGVLLFFHEHITAAEFILFMLLAPGLIEPIGRIVMISGLLDGIGEGIIRIQGVLNQRPLMEPLNPIQPESNAVAFNNVSFGYESKSVLHHLSCSLRSGTINGLVGPSGAGKSTAARLIPRFWDVGQGQITIDGIDIRHISSSDLMKMVAFVFQDVYLMNDSIMENIRMGNYSASEAQVMEAARSASAHEFIQELERGYQTMVGEGGAHLSGGEKQRISIARAFLKDSPILILDEMTSAMDPENEHRIFDALNRLMRGKTVIVIAHRLPTIMHADQLLLFENGSLRASGKHDKLMKDLLYAKLWKGCAQASEWRLVSEEADGKDHVAHH